MRRLLVWSLIFAALTIGGAAFALWRSDTQLADLAALGSLPTATLAILVALAAALYGTDVLRYRVFGRAIGERVTWRAGLDASVANFFFSWLTPGAAMGAPATIYMLSRHGVSWHGAALIAFGKSLTGIALILVVTATLLALGAGPALDPSIVFVLVPGVAVVALLCALLVASARWPKAACRRVDGIENWLASRRALSGPRAGRMVGAIAEATRRAIAQLAALTDAGWRGLASIVATHALYFAALVGLGTVIATSLGATSTPRAVGITTVFVAFSYVAPTPGGAGLAEASAVLFYSRVLPAADAVATVLLFRALTFYLHIAFGLVYLLVRTGVSGFRDISQRQNQPAD